MLGNVMFYLSPGKFILEEDQVLMQFKGNTGECYT